MVTTLLLTRQRFASPLLDQVSRCPKISCGALVEWFELASPDLDGLAELLTDFSDAVVVPHRGRLLS
ncbi:MAG: hypothetical protein ACRDR6_18090 [Pseudonocardiaceae bacterium]